MASTQLLEPPVGQPLYGASPWRAIARFWKGYVTFSGRASRSEFWWAMLFAFLLSLVVQVPFWIAYVTLLIESIRLDETDPNGDPSALLRAMAVMFGWMIPLLLFALAFALPVLAVTWRRLQDAGFHGAFALMHLASLGLVPLIMCALPTDPAGIRFDPGYRAQQAAAYAAHLQAYGYAGPASGQQPYPQQDYRGG